MRLVRFVLLLVGSVAALTVHAQTVGGIWEGKVGGLNPQPSLRIDFDSGLASINAGPPIPLTLSPNTDPLVVQFEIPFAGRPMRFTGRMNGSDISGTIANFTVSLTRLPDTTPRLAARQRYPFPRQKEAEAIAKAREIVADLVAKQEIPAARYLSGTALSQAAILAATSGEMVRSESATYSDTSPVLAGTSRWLMPGSTTTSVVGAFLRALASAPSFSAWCGGTCVSSAPLITNSG